VGEHQGQGGEADDPVLTQDPVLAMVRSSIGTLAINNTCTSSSRSAATSPVMQPREFSPVSHDPRSPIPPPATHRQVTNSRLIQNAATAPWRICESLRAAGP